MNRLTVDVAGGALAVANDFWIIAIVAVGFPLFGLGVFFFWRWQYGVWSLKRPAKSDHREVVHVPMGPAPRGDGREPR